MNIKKVLRQLQQLSADNQDYLANYKDDSERPGEIDKMYLMGFSDGLIYAVNKIKLVQRGEENENN